MSQIRPARAATSPDRDRIEYVKLINGVCALASILERISLTAMYVIIPKLKAYLEAVRLDSQQAHTLLHSNEYKY
eukprot:2401023-Pleurochrysis_carterae.AAC.2